MHNNSWIWTMGWRMGFGWIISFIAIVGVRLVEKGANQ